MTLTNKTKAVLWWIFSFLFMAVIAYYQRATGPTNPIRGKVYISDELVKYKLIRTFGGEGDAIVAIPVGDTAIKGTITYKRFNSNDSITIRPMLRGNGKLTAHIPHQPPAGKVEYSITLSKGKEAVNLSKTPAIIRFKGEVPAFVMIPHILCMFIAMIFSTRAGIEALLRGNKSYIISFIAFLSLLIGGGILGPIVQNYAFNAYWTGWPVGKDLTDNKTLAAIIVWLIAIVKLRKDRMHRGWVIAASIILLATYLIPHSLFGSELNHTKP